ncbi:SseB family protein [Streptomyces californicus]|uniref:SseB family protein n=1 Tax=Streptomyces californicus TaxID=67351 RepID=A0ABD7D1J2_9ACTN|nr:MULTISPECIES: type VII secretion system-associated protein [Streptomyces]QRV27738.1 SseB family protein [Streptomyces californicus]QRV36598.1 SseB family protein [Streptomyces californicus]QRV41137.1 SseB family protein [Streptomyces californicus]QRV47892.1 SseB family protein [Streptomyces californicus]
MSSTGNATDGTGVGVAPVVGTDTEAGGRTDSGGGAWAGEAGAAMPPVPDDIRAAARTAPEHWLGTVDPAWRGEGEPPLWAVIGQWRSDADGEIVEWQRNEHYRPSPGMLGWPEPTDDVDAAMQLAATGYGPVENVALAAVAAELAVLTAPDGGAVSACTPEGDAVVPVFTSPEHLKRAGALAHRVLPLAEAFALVPEGQDLYLNPTGPVALRLSADDLSRAVDVLEAVGESAASSAAGSPVAKEEQN